MRAIRTPIAFIVLIVLVGEAILLAVGLSAGVKGSSQAFLIHGTFWLVAVAFVMVILLAIFRPEALWGKRPQTDAANRRKKLKKGDRVVVRPDLVGKRVVRNDGIIDWDPKMSAYKGRPAKIVEVDVTPPLSYVIDIDANSFKWAAEWLERQ